MGVGYHKVIIDTYYILFIRNQNDVSLKVKKNKTNKKKPYNRTEMLKLMKKRSPEHFNSNVY